MEARNTPSFTTAIRGYDREEVDEYVDSLAKALEDLEEASDQNRRLQSHLSRLNARIVELEERIRSETPHTVGALGERITLVLTEAETGAARALEEAESKASAIVEKAQAEARKLESEAQTKASRLVEEAERRALARTRQVEEWEQQVVAHTHAQQAYQARLQQEVEESHNERMAHVAADHEATMASLRDVRDSVDRLLQRAAEAPAPAYAGSSAEDDEPVIFEPDPLEEDFDPVDDNMGEAVALQSPGAFDTETTADEPEASDARTERRTAVEPITASVRAVS